MVEVFFYSIQLPTTRLRCRINPVTVPQIAKRWVQIDVMGYGITFPEPAASGRSVDIEWHDWASTECSRAPPATIPTNST